MAGGVNRLQFGVTGVDWRGPEIWIAQHLDRRPPHRDHRHPRRMVRVPVCNQDAVEVDPGKTRGDLVDVIGMAGPGVHERRPRSDQQERVVAGRTSPLGSVACGEDSHVPLLSSYNSRVPAEEFTSDERARLAPYFTNLDRTVFALTNLPETVKGALFARYSRSAKSLRRLFLDEFARRRSTGTIGAGDRRRRRRHRARRKAVRSASSTTTATTRSRSSAARTSPASTSRTS